MQIGFGDMLESNQIFYDEVTSLLRSFQNQAEEQNEDDVTTVNRNHFNNIKRDNNINNINNMQRNINFLKQSNNIQGDETIPVRLNNQIILNRPLNVQPQYNNNYNNQVVITNPSIRSTNPQVMINSNVTQRPTNLQPQDNNNPDLTTINFGKNSINKYLKQSNNY